MNKLLFFTFIFSLSANAISENKTEFKISCLSPKFAYLNGILNKKIKENKDSGDLIQKLLKISAPIYPIFNRSGGSKDLIISLKQKAEEYDRSRKWFEPPQNIFVKLLEFSLNDNYKEIESQLTKLQNSNAKIILFSHSQGNLYANELCLNLGKNSFTNIQIATPASEILCGTKYTSIKGDEMLFMVNLAKYLPESSKFSLAQTLPPLKENRNQELNYEESFFKFRIHSIYNYMINPHSFEKIKADYESTLSEEFKKESAILSSEKYKITCDNIESYSGKNIDLISKSGKPEPVNILGKSEKVNGIYQTEKLSDSQYRLFKKKPFMFLDGLPSFLKSIIYFGVGIIGLLLASLFFSVGAGVMRRDHEDRIRQDEEWRKRNGHH